MTVEREDSWQLAGKNLLSEAVQIYKWRFDRYGPAELARESLRE